MINYNITFEQKIAIAEWLNVHINIVQDIQRKLHAMIEELVISKMVKKAL